MGSNPAIPTVVMPELVDGPDCGSGRCGFESRWPPKVIKMSKIEDIKYLRDITGCGIAQGKKAIEICGDREIAVEFLKLHGQALARYKKVNNKKIPWDNFDYYKEAKRRIKK